MKELVQGIAIECVLNNTIVCACACVYLWCKALWNVLLLEGEIQVNFDFILFWFAV